MLCKRFFNIRSRRMHHYFPWRRHDYNYATTIQTSSSPLCIVIEWLVTCYVNTLPTWLCTYVCTSEYCARTFTAHVVPDIFPLNLLFLVLIALVLLSISNSGYLWPIFLSTTLIRNCPLILIVSSIHPNGSIICFFRFLIHWNVLPC